MCRFPQRPDGLGSLRWPQRLVNQQPGVLEAAIGLGTIDWRWPLSGASRGPFLRAALEEGLFILGCGTRSVRFRPALNISRELLDEGLARVRRALQRIPAVQPA